MGDDLTTRDRMILLAIDQLIEVGPVDFNSGLVCDQLGIKHPMIKHHFGSKDNLLAEAIIWAFRGWSYFQVAALKNAKDDPELQIRAFISSEIAWAEELKAVAAVTQYPLMSANVRRILGTTYQPEMQALFEYHLALLTTVIVALRTKTKADLSFSVEDYPRKELVLKQPKAFLAASSVSWATHGLGMWSTGDHLSTKTLATDIVAGLTKKVAIANHIENIMNIAKGL